VDKLPGKSGVNKRFTLVFVLLEQEGIISSRERGKVAEDLGLEPSRLSEILNGKRNLTTEELANFVRMFRVNPFYILFETLPVFLDNDSTEEFIEMSVDPIINPTAPLKGKSDLPDKLQMVAEPDMKYGKKDIKFKTVDGDIISLSQIAQWLGVKEAKKIANKKSSAPRKKRR